MSRSLKTAIVVPTLNAGKTWQRWIDIVKQQSLAVDKVIVIDSQSSDKTCELAQLAGFDVSVIPRSEFNHGGTRQFAIEQLNEIDVVILLTQDAVLQNETSIESIVKPFADIKVAAVCGRQLPYATATSISAHARMYNYPATSNQRVLSDRDALGIKSVFLSNSFAAYRVPSLLDVGGFPDDVIFGEDMFVAAKLLLSGSAVAYSAQACVYHSHNYSLIQEFNRYFDIGVFHSRQNWIRAEFGSAEKEGRKFILSELKYVMKHQFWKVAEVLVRSVLKYVGYRLGVVEASLPNSVKLMCSMNPNFFKTN